MTDLMHVIPGDPRRVGFAEENVEHPNGAAWVAGDALYPDREPKPVQIAMTPNAMQALARGNITRVFPAEPELVEAEPEEEDYNVLTLPQLRAELNARGLDDKGRKSVLVERLMIDDGSAQVQIKEGPAEEVPAGE